MIGENGKRSLELLVASHKMRHTENVTAPQEPVLGLQNSTLGLLFVPGLGAVLAKSSPEVLVSSLPLWSELGEHAGDVGWMDGGHVWKGCFS